MSKVGDFFKKAVGGVLTALSYATGEVLIDKYLSSASMVQRVVDKKLSEKSNQYQQVLRVAELDLGEHRQELARQFLREVSDETRQTLQADYKTNVQVILTVTALVIGAIIILKMLRR